MTRPQRLAHFPQIVELQHGGQVGQAARRLQRLVGAHAHAAEGGRRRGQRTDGADRVPDSLTVDTATHCGANSFKYPNTVR